MSKTQEMREKLIKARDKRGWDNKDWHRATGIDQRVLEAIDAGLIDMSLDSNEGLANIILQSTKKNKLPDLLRFDEPQVISFGIHKGGAGKTTISVNLGCELGRRGYNVLLIDADSQTDCTTTVMPKESEEAKKEDDSYTKKIERMNLFACLTAKGDDLDIRKHILETPYDGLDFVAATTDLSRMDVMLSGMDFRETIFQQALEGVMSENYYDFIIVDMDKNINLFNTTILCGCEYVVMPSEAEFYNLKGAIVYGEQIEKVQKYNKKLKLLGIVFNKVNTRKIAVDVSRETMQDMFGDKVFENFVRVDANVGNSQLDCTPLLVYNRSSRAAHEIRAVTDELLERLKKEKGI